MQDPPALPQQIAPDHADKVLNTLYLDFSQAKLQFNMFDQLERLGDQHQFELVVFNIRERFLRDPFLVRNDGSLLFPATTQPALAFAATDLRLHKAPFSIVTGTRFTALSEEVALANQQLWQQRMNTTGQSSDIYFEGGNVISTVCDGQPTVFVGMTDVYLTAGLHRHIEAPLQATSNSFTLNKKDELFDLSFASRTADETLRQGVLSTAMQDPADILRYRVYPEEFRPNSIVPSAESYSPRQLDAVLAQRALQSLIQFEAAAEKMASTFGIPRDRLYILEQVLYHIDLIAQPGPRGIMLLQDPNADIGRQWLGGKTPAVLGPALLVQQKEQALRIALQRNIETAQSAGCDVIPVDGTKVELYAQPPGPILSRIPLSLLNGIVGTSASTGQKLYLTADPGANYAEQVAAFRQQLATLDMELILLPYYAPQSNAGVGCILQVQGQCLVDSP